MPDTICKADVDYLVLFEEMGGSGVFAEFNDKRVELPESFAPGKDENGKPIQVAIAVAQNFAPSEGAQWICGSHRIEEIDGKQWARTLYRCVEGHENTFGDLAVLSKLGSDRLFLTFPNRKPPTKE